MGSGPSGVHLSRELLARGRCVRLFDVGHEAAPAVEPSRDLAGLRAAIDDPVDYFLGEDLSGVALPGRQGEFYGFPPQKSFVFARPEGIRERAEGFEPLSSWARGGLARAWTAGVYPFNDAELASFPFGLETLLPFYGRVAGLIGVTGERDDLETHMPWHEGVGAPLDLDGHGRLLANRYRKVRERVVDRLDCRLGRSRVAVLSEPRGDRAACDYLGRCLWGCPVGALYTPDHTLRECFAYPGFTYEPGLLAEAFGFDAERRIRTLRVRPASGGPSETRPVETLALAAGTLSTARIVLRSWWEATGETPRLGGLMDNRQVLVPFVNPGRVGRPHDARAYQYHQLCVGLAAARAEHYVHGQITTLTTAQAHPILETMPFDLRTAGFVFRNVRAGLGLVNLNFHDTRRDSCSVALGGRTESEPVLEIRYVPPPDEPARIREAVKRTRRFLRALGCFVAPGAIHVRPMGASVHYAGTLPMSAEPRPFTVSPTCRSHDFENLVIADGSTFPFLPAKNITFTLMANAIRVAGEAFE